MWSGLLPPGVTESDLSEEEEGGPGPSGATAGVSETCLTKFQALQKRCSELQVESRKKRRRHRKGKKQLLEEEKNNESPAPGTPPALETLQKYFGVNDHLEPPVCMKIMKKSRLEQNLDEALKKGDVEDAEELSDRLATREIAVKITKAAAYHRHMKAKEEPQSSREAVGKTRPPAWGFEAKKRWETKSNMGYM